MMLERKAAESVFNRLRRAYLLALALIALAVISEQVLVDGFLTDQAGDAEIINVAGRQRMLSQRIARFAGAGPGMAGAERREFAERHEWLKQALIKSPLRERLLLLDTTVAVLSAAVEDRSPAEAVRRVSGPADDFLVRMDAIVADFSRDAAAKVARLQRAKRWLTVGTLIVLLLEALFIFRPISRFVEDRLTELSGEREAQEAARRLAEEAVTQKERNLGELRALNRALDEATIYATLEADGTVGYASRRFREMLGLRNEVVHRPLPALFSADPAGRAVYAETLSAARAGSWRGEWELTGAEGRIRQLDVSLIPARWQGGRTEIFLLANEITEQREATEALEKMAAERLAEEIERGRQRSRQAAEVQEKERLRIARDLHDGIGQKLTALKFSLELLNPGEDEKLGEALKQLRELSREIIRGVRLATYNLSPPELSDYGLVASLEKMCAELARLTGQRIVLRNGGWNGRLSGEREVHLYRIVQEAINNALKYAAANYILVTLSAGKDLLSITIDDDGNGFDPDELRESSDGGGLGLTSMEERVADLGGRIFLRSHNETGTRITVNIPL